MGIKGLNSYLKKTVSSKGIQNEHIGNYRGKTLVFDTSIYIYKFLEQGSLINNMYLLIKQCFDNGIRPLFIFDGKPEDNKKDILISRCKKKNKAFKTYEKLKEKYEAGLDLLSNVEKKEILRKMTSMRKRSIRVTEENIADLKDLMESLGVYYFEAPYEADIICAYYVISGIAWACVSDDMDMLAYNCPRVIREWNIFTKRMTLYDLSVIQNEINIPKQYLSQVLVFIGNDYLKTQNSTENTFSLFQNYLEKNENEIDFYEWLVLNNIINDEKRLELLNICNLYDVPEQIIMKKPSHNKNKINKIALRNILNKNAKTI